jgi:protein-S-isoprenylcysteine O-methyltransferase Ste14
VSLDDVELVVRWLGAGLLAFAWAGSAIGAARAAGHPPGRALGLARGRGAMVAYLPASVPYLAACVLLWRPLPVEPSDGARIVFLAIGGVLGAVGFALYVGGRIALGEMYNVSSSLGSELFADHRLVVSGPYRSVRHPMYLGIAIAALGALLVYRTWTMVFVLLASPGLAVKARHEDRLLFEQLGEGFAAYRSRVPGWLPRVRGRKAVASGRSVDGGRWMRWTSSPARGAGSSSGSSSRS